MLLNYSQQDAHEFLKLFTEEMAKQKHSDNSFENLFNTSITSEVKCSTCKTINKTLGSVSELFLDIGKKSIENALQSFFEDEVVQYRCESCKATVSARKKFFLEKAPDSLCIALKRFTASQRKINGNIDISTNLNLSQYFSENQTREWKYKLVAVINHIGKNPNSGHYTTITNIDNQYYMFDDSNVESISENEVLGSNAYILFYQLIQVFYLFF